MTEIAQQTAGTAQSRPPGIAAFDTVYDRMILNRSFVEYRGYYVQARGRYRKTAALVGTLRLQPGARHLDIGGGQMALLCRNLFGFHPVVGDVVERAARDVVEQGAAFQKFDLLDDRYEADAPYDLITLLEVIEHIPHPPYITFAKLAHILKPGGWLVLTTPNGFRICNVLRMLANREVLDIYRYPEEGQPLGHQHEYTVRQMDWQLRHARFAPQVCRTYVTGWRGASPAARFAHLATVPFNLAPHLRDGLMAAAKAPESVSNATN